MDFEEAEEAMKESDFKTISDKVVAFMDEMDEAMFDS